MGFLAQVQIQERNTVSMKIVRLAALVQCNDTICTY